MKEDVKISKKELWDIAMDADISIEQKDFIERFVGDGTESEFHQVTDFFQNLVKTNFNNNPEEFQHFIRTKTKKEPDIYSEVPNRPKAMRHLKKSIDQNHFIYLYTDSDADGTASSAIAQVFEEGMGKKIFEVNSLADTSIQSLDPEHYPSTATHGLNAHQFIQDFQKNPNQGPITIMTADNGMSSKADVQTIREFCNEKGIKVDFLITDHHVADEKDAVVGIGQPEPDDLTVVNLEQNENHGRYTLSGGQKISHVLQEYMTLESANKDNEYMTVKSVNKAIKVMKEIGDWSAVADVVNDGKIHSTEKMAQASRYASTLNKLRGLDVFMMKSVKMNTKDKPEIKELLNLCNNFLNYIDKPAAVLGNNLYNKGGVAPIGGFTSIPHLQVFVNKISCKRFINKATADEEKKLEIFETKVLDKLTAFRAKVYQDAKENTDSNIQYRESEELHYKEILSPVFSTAAANQVWPAPSKSITFATRPMDKNTRIISGSFRSKSIKLQDLLTKDVVKKLEDKDIKNIYIKGHHLAAGFNCKVGKSQNNPEDAIFEVFNEEITRVANLDDNKDSQIYPDLSAKDVALYKQIQEIYGMTERKGDFECPVVSSDMLKNLVVNKKGENILVSDIIVGKKEGLSGFFVSPQTLGEVSPLIVSGLDAVNDDSVIKCSTGSFANVENSKNIDTRKIEESNLESIKTEMKNTIGFKQKASEYINTHPYQDLNGGGYFTHIESELRKGKINSISELDVEAGMLGKAPGLTNIGIIQFYLEDDELMVERNTFLVNSGVVHDNSNERLTKITNSAIRDIGLSLDETSELFLKIFSKDKGVHEIRAFNSRYDLNVLLSNLNEDVRDVLKTNVLFTDTLKVAKEFNLGSWSAEKYIDVVNPVNDKVFIKAVRVEDYEKFINNEIDTLTSVKGGNTFKRLPRTKYEFKVVKSATTTNSVQSIMDTVIADMVSPEDPYHYKLIFLGKYNSQDYVLDNLDLVSGETGLTKGQIIKVIENVKRYNESPSEKEKDLMKTYDIPAKIDFFEEKHNNLDRCGDIDYEGIIIWMVKGMSEDKIRKAYGKASKASIPMKESIISDHNGKTPQGFFQKEQFRKLGKPVRDDLMLVEDKTSPLSINPKFNILVNKDVTPDEEEIISTLSNLVFLDLVKTKEFKGLNDIIVKRGLKFKPYVTETNLRATLRQLTQAIKDEKKQTIKNRVRALEESVIDHDVLEGLLSEDGINVPEDVFTPAKTEQCEFKNIEDSLGKPLNKEDANWKKVDIAKRNLLKGSYLFNARQLIKDNKPPTAKQKKSLSQE
jgi:hypothetical protein